MSEGEAFGWMAAGLTLLSSSMRAMVWLRMVAVAASACFLVYGWLAGLYPVVVLHGLLLPCHVHRLLELIRDPRAAPADSCDSPAAVPQARRGTGPWTI